MPAYLQSGRAATWLAFVVATLATQVLGQGPPSLTEHSPPGGAAQAIQTFAGLPMTFEANEGQSDARVKFLSRGAGYTLFLTQQEAVLSLAQPAKSRGQPNVVRLKFAGSNGAAPIIGRDLLRANSNYFLGKDPKQWHTNVPNYAGAAYHGVYPGVDAIFHGSSKDLEFDFEVAPGADTGAIAIDVQGARRLRVDSQGDIALSIGSAGKVVLAKPRVYQDAGGQRREIAGKFVVRGRHRLGFSVGPYDRSMPLVIDPTLTYSTYIAGNGTDQVNSIAVDTFNDAYLAGTTSSSNFPISPSGAYQSTCPACSFLGVAFVTKLDPTKSGASSLIYSTYVGPEGPASVMPDLLGSSSGNAIIVDNSGDAYLTGQANSNYFPANNPPSQNASSCGAFVVELDPNGTNLLGSRCIGGAANDQGNAIARDTSGNIYVGGITQTAGLAVPANAVQTGLHGSRNPFIAKLSSNLNSLLYFTYLGGSGGDIVSGIAVDAAGEAYLGGMTFAGAVLRSLPFPTAVSQYGANSTARGNGQGFVTKISSDATQLLFAGFLGGLQATSVSALALDASGNAYVTGSSLETDLQPATNPSVAGPNCQTSGTTCPESFVAEFNPHVSSNQLVFLSYFGGVTLPNGVSGTAPSKGNAIALDASGDIFVAGVTGATDFPAPGITPSSLFTPITGLPGLPCASLLTCSAGFLAEFSPGAAAINYATYLGGAGSASDGGSGQVKDQARAMALDSSSDVYLAGLETSQDFPTTSNALMPGSPHFGSDGFFAVVKGVVFPPIVISPQSIPGATAGTSYGPVQFSATGGVGAIAITEMGALPTGITFTNATLSGTPTVTGSFPITITATDNIGNMATENLTLVVAMATLQPAIVSITEPITVTDRPSFPDVETIHVTDKPTVIAFSPLSLSPQTIPGATAGTTYMPLVQFSATGGVSPITITEMGALPMGITFANAALSGTPTVTGSFPITITATDNIGNMASENLTLVVAMATLQPVMVSIKEPITVTDRPSFPDVETIKVTDTVTVTVLKGTPVITWSNPASINYGTALGATQLNATASVQGTFVYSPSSGKILQAAPNQNLMVTFTPNDAAHYTTATKTVQINVNPAVLTVTANNSSRAYKTANPTFTASYNGFVNADTFLSAVKGSPSLTTTAVLLSPPGTYPIAAALGTLSAANYTFAFKNGTLTVTPGGSVPSSGTACNVAPGSYYTGAFVGDLHVSNTQNCAFQGGTVIGNVFATSGDVALSNATVTGDVQITGAALGLVCSTSINGTVTVNNNNGLVDLGEPQLGCAGNTIGGDLDVFSNKGATAADGNTVKGNVNANSNTGPTGIFNNRINNTLTCQNNKTIQGSGNTAKSKAGQCAKF